MYPKFKLNMDLLNIAPSTIQSLDDWMIKEIDFREVHTATDLGFKHLNDLLFYKYFNTVAQRMMTQKKRR